MTSVIPLFGVLVVLLFSVGQEGERDFLFLQVGAEARLVPRCGFHLEIFPETSPKAPHNFFPEFSSSLGSTPLTQLDEGIGNSGRTKPSCLRFYVFFKGGAAVGTFPPRRAWPGGGERSKI